MNEMHDGLLHAALLCGLDVEETDVHRVHLFFAALHDLHGFATIASMQRALHVGVAAGAWRHVGPRASGRYALTSSGLAEARARFPGAQARYPQLAPDDVAFELRSSSIAGKSIRLWWSHGRFETFLDGEQLSAVKVCEWLAQQQECKLPARAKYAPRHIWDLGVQEGWTARWLGPQIPPPEARCWALLANPLDYNIQAAVEQGGADTWTLKSGDPRPGDRGLIWMTKGSGRQRGVIAFFVVTAAPAQIEESPEARGLWRRTAPALVARRMQFHYVRPPGLPLWLDEQPDLLGDLGVSRSQGNKLYTVEPEQFAAVVEAAGGWVDDPEGPDGPGGGAEEGGQGHLQDAKKRKAIELHAMECARQHFMAQGWPRPVDTSQGNPYDWLFIKEDGTQLRVEVKGTQGGAKHVLVTVGETLSAWDARTAMFVQHGIKVTKLDSGEFDAMGGTPLVLDPWMPADADLEPLTFRYLIR